MQTSSAASVIEPFIAEIDGLTMRACTPIRSLRCSSTTSRRTFVASNGFLWSALQENVGETTLFLIGCSRGAGARGRRAKGAHGRTNSRRARAARWQRHQDRDRARAAESLRALSMDEEARGGMVNGLVIIIIIIAFVSVWRHQDRRGHRGALAFGDDDDTEARGVARADGASVHRRGVQSRRRCLAPRLHGREHPWHRQVPHAAARSSGFARAARGRRRMFRARRDGRVFVRPVA